MTMPDEVRAKEREMFVDAWEFRKKFYQPENTDEYWRAVMREAEKLGVKYNNWCFYRILRAFVDDFEYRAKNK